MCTKLEYTNLKQKKTSRTELKSLILAECVLFSYLAAALNWNSYGSLIWLEEFILKCIWMDGCIIEKKKYLSVLELQITINLC